MTYFSLSGSTVAFISNEIKIIFHLRVQQRHSLGVLSRRCLALSSSSYVVVIVSISVGRIDPGCPDVPQGGRSCSIYSFPRWPMNNNYIWNSKERAFHAQVKHDVVLLTDVVLFLFRRFPFVIRLK